MKQLHIKTEQTPASTSLRMLCLCLMVLTPMLARTEGGFPYPNSYYSDVKGTELHHRHWPAIQEYKGSVLLLHGFGGSSFSWQEIATELQQFGFEVVAVDLPPFGYSDKNVRVNQSVSSRARLMLAFLSEVYPGRQWHLAGHSMGAGVVQAMGLIAPDQVMGICFVAGALFGEVKPGKTAAGRQYGLLGVWPVRDIAGGMAGRFFITRSRVQGLLRSAYGTEPTPAQIESYAKALRLPGTARALLAGGRFSFETDHLNASEMQVPVISIWGEKDSWVPFESRRKIAESMSNAGIVIIPDAGHNPMETHKEAFLSAWIPFLLGNTVKDQSEAKTPVR